MNQSAPTVPSLLSLSAPVGRERQKSAPADGFAEELDAAATQDNSHRDQPSTRETHGVEPAESPPSSEQQLPANAADDSRTGPPTEDDNLEGDEAALLSVTAATETLVVPTSPDAVLPAEAATTLDVAAIADASDPESDGQFQAIGEGDQLADTTLPTAEASLSDGNDELLPAPPDSKRQLPDEIAPDAALNEESQPAVPSTDEQVTQSTAIVTDAEQGIRDGSAAPAESTAAQSASSPDDSIDQPSLPTEAESARVSAPIDDGASDEAGDDNKASKDPALATVAKESPPAVDAATTSETTSDSSVREPSITPTDATPGTDPDRVRPGRVESIESRPTVDTARFVSRVAGAVNSANERGGPIEIRLSPPELGALRVSIEVKEGVLTAQLEAETPAARATLLDNLPALRDRLEQQQIRIDKFDVDVRDESSQRDSDWQPPERDGQRPDERPDRREPRRSPTESRRTSTQAESTTPRTITFDTSGINLVA